MGVFSGETANLTGGFRIGYERNQSSDARVRCGSGVTIATVTQSGGEVEINSLMTTIVRTGGTMTHKGTGTITTLTNLAGTFFDECTGTITTLNNFAVFDRTRVLSAQTITTAKLYKGSKTLVPRGRTAPAYGVIFTNAVEFHGCDPTTALLAVGQHKKWTIADI